MTDLPRLVVESLLQPATITASVAVVAYVTTLKVDNRLQKRESLKAGTEHLQEKVLPPVYQKIRIEYHDLVELARDCLGGRHRFKPGREWAKDAEAVVAEALHKIVTDSQSSELPELFLLKEHLELEVVEAALRYVRAKRAHLLAITHARPNRCEP